MEVDFVKCVVWVPVPVTTTLVAYSGIKKMAPPPALANVLQMNYNTLDMFLSEMAGILIMLPSTPSPKNNKTTPG